MVAGREVRGRSDALLQVSAERVMMSGRKCRKAEPMLSVGPFDKNILLLRMWNFWPLRLARRERERQNPSQHHDA